METLYEKNTNQQASNRTIELNAQLSKYIAIQSIFEGKVETRTMNETNWNL